PHAAPPCPPRSGRAGGRPRHRPASSSSPASPRRYRSPSRSAPATPGPYGPRPPRRRGTPWDRALPRRHPSSEDKILTVQASTKPGADPEAVTAVAIPTFVSVLTSATESDDGG